MNTFEQVLQSMKDTEVTGDHELAHVNGDQILSEALITAIEEGWTVEQASALVEVYNKASQNWWYI